MKPVPEKQILVICQSLLLNNEALWSCLAVGKWGHIPIVNSTLLTMIYLSHTAWTLTVGAAVYSWSGTSSLSAFLIWWGGCATSGIFKDVCIEKSHLMYKPFGYWWCIAKELHGFPVYALQFLDCRTEDAGRRPTFSDDFPAAIGYKMFPLKFSESKEDSRLTFCSS